MRSYYNPVTKLRKGEKPLTVLERLHNAVSNIDLAGLSAATERIADSMSAVAESLKQIKIPEIEWDEVHMNLGSFDTKEKAEAAAVGKAKELAECLPFFE